MATFSLTDTIRRANGTGNGNNVDFSFSFQVNSTSDIEVYVDDVKKTFSQDYTIVNSTGAAGLNTNGTGVVRFTTAPANNTTVSVLSNLPLSRSNNYQAGGSITAVSLEDDFDTTFMKLGDNAEKIQRVLKAPPSESTTADLTIPNATTRANKNLSFDANGEPTVSSSAISSASVSSTTTGSPGSNAQASAAFNSTTGNVDFTFTIPSGAQGQAGNDGVFNAIASQTEAEAGTENTKGMTPLRVAQAINTQVSGVTAVASKFFGVKTTTDSVGRTILQQEHTLVGGSENLKISDYDTYFFATGSVGLTLRASDGHLLIDLP